MATTYEEEKKKAVDSIRQAMQQSGATVNDYSDYIKEYHKAQEDAALADIENAYKKNTATLDRAGKEIPVQYEGARNQAAGNAARTQRNNDLYAAAAGLGSGTGAQARLATGVALQNNLNDINKAEAAAKADIELQRTQLATDYENAIAKAKANGNATLADALYKEYVRADESLVAQNQYWQNMALDVNRLAETLAQNQWTRDTADQQYKDNLIRAQEQDKLAADKYADQQTQQKWENEYKDRVLATDREMAGLPAETITNSQYLNAIKDGGVKQFWSANPSGTGFLLPVAPVPTPVVPSASSNWDNMKNEVSSIIQAGNEAEVMHYVDKVLDTLTPAQQEELLNMVMIAGYRL